VRKLPLCLYIFATAFSFLFVWPATAKTICGIEFISPQQVQKTVSQVNGLIPNFTDPQYVSYFDRVNSIAWAFTTEKNLAHPAVLCRMIAVENNEYVIKQDVRRGGPEQACSGMVAGFDELNRKTIQTLKAQSSPAQ
jgi:hypothetical protein